MEINDLFHLLKDIENIREKNSVKKLESTRRGEDFNVFNVLGLWSEEVRLHSAFLTELLNPLGRHGCGDEFLKAFLSILGISMDESINLGKAVVTAEFYIGVIDNEYEKGGRIDILVEMPQESTIPSIIIENKIYASDQYNQLRRYHNYALDNIARDKFKNFKIIYLTLHGTPPTEVSLGNGDDIQFLCISYSEHISKWLRHCAALAFDKPKVRETIIQYLHLVKQLTAYDMNEINSIVNHIAADNKTLMSAVLVCSYKNDIIKLAITKIINPHLEKIAETANKVDSSITVAFESATDFAYFGDKPDWWFEYNISNKETKKNVCLRFIFNNWGLINLYYGIIKQKTSQNVAPLDVFGNKGGSWPWGWRWFDGYKDWNGENLLRILEEITTKGEHSEFSKIIKNAISKSSELCK